MFFAAAIPAVASVASAAIQAKGANKGDSSDALERVKAPKWQDLEVQLAEAVRQGELTPAQADTILQEQTALSDVSEDPRLRGAQIEALDELEGIVRGGGLDARSRADLYQIGAEQGTRNRGEQEAILQNARARGVGGSDLEFVNRLVAQQGAATRSSAAGMDAAALAEARKMQAIEALGSLGGTVRNADYARKANEAQAIDAINRFNAANRQQQTNLAVGDVNEAQRLNLGEKQRIADRNVDIGNREQEFNSNQRLNRYRAMTGQAGQISQANARDAAAQAQSSQALGQTIGNFGQQAARIFGGQQNDDVNVTARKETAASMNPGQVLDEFTGARRPQSRQAAPAQVDPAQLGRMILAALADAPEGNR